MDQDIMLQKVVARTGYTREEAREFYLALVDVLAETLGQGETVECMPEWGRFIPKLRENPGRNENSPRHPKKASYFIQFKAGKQFEYSLFAAAGLENRRDGADN